ncbi:MAG: ATP-dependent zinc metalloprotease FtsH [Candidatus Palauibacterales bacterium]|nr:ATP-dependent zinc metalloprotease FtsH [Candidatus Palauibacterales bacterium]MDP2530125.1 ATP-dependent zinc metalloprotease FtsH [Candidatus Palauibacterales bacterium]MDP2582564.1 ATP-dependent zinc metalloprotease FtsH [Candidatus Palauibacterales bacterium]
MRRIDGPGQQAPRLQQRQNWSGGRKGGLVWLVLAALLLAWLWSPLGRGSTHRTNISYTRFHRQVVAGNVQRVTVKGQQIEGTLSRRVKTKGPDGKSLSYKQFTTYVPSFGDPTLLGALREKGVTVEAEPPSSFSWWGVILQVAPFLLLLWLGWLFFSRMRQRGQSLFSMGRADARAYDRTDEATTFEDVAGLEGAKRELEEIIEFLKDPERFQRLGGEIPHGVLLVGPPGTGKTLLARAVAGEAAAPFFNMTGSDFMEMLVGVGASRIRDLFKEAKKSSPSIIFIDELDSIGRRRGAGLGGGHDEREQTLNQLLSEMDGFDPTHEVIVMAATNRPDILDPALLRPGRFDRRIRVDLPTRVARRDILALHARDKPLADDVDLDEVARGTPGFSGADLKNLLNEAALLAAREDKQRIGADDIESARDKVMMGLERENLALTNEEKELLAYHEGGHTVVAAVLPDADPIHKVTIVPRGRAMGVTQQLPERDKYLYRREYILDRLAVMMGGRAAEDLVMDTATSGAEQDLEQATHLARKMVLDWGMSERFKDVSLGGARENVFLGEQIARGREYSDATARDVDQEVQKILDEAYARATGTLREHRSGLDRLAAELQEKEELRSDRVLAILGLDGMPADREAGERERAAGPGGGGRDIDHPESSRQSESTTTPA